MADDEGDDVQPIPGVAIGRTRQLPKSRKKARRLVHRADEDGADGEDDEEDESERYCRVALQISDYNALESSYIDENNSLNQGTLSPSSLRSKGSSHSSTGRMSSNSKQNHGPYQRKSVYNELMELGGEMSHQSDESRDGFGDSLPSRRTSSSSGGNNNKYTVDIQGHQNSDNASCDDDCEDGGGNRRAAELSGNSGIVNVDHVRQKCFFCMIQTIALPPRCEPEYKVIIHTIQEGLTNTHVRDLALVLHQYYLEDMRPVLKRDLPPEVYRIIAPEMTVSDVETHLYLCIKDPRVFQGSVIDLMKRLTMRAGHRAEYAFMTVRDYEMRGQPVPPEMRFDDKMVNLFIKLAQTTAQFYKWNPQGSMFYNPNLNLTGNSESPLGAYAKFANYPSDPIPGPDDYGSMSGSPSQTPNRRRK